MLAGLDKEFRKSLAEIDQAALQTLLQEAMLLNEMRKRRKS